MIRRSREAVTTSDVTSHVEGQQQPADAPLFPDAESFAAILPEHDDYLRGVAWAVVRNSDAIDDVMQATYEKAYRSLRGFDGRSSLRTWLHTICYRTAIDFIRSASRRPAVSLDATNTDGRLLSDTSAPASSLSNSSMFDSVDKRLEATEVMARLDPEQRALLYFTAGLGYSYDEVAEIVDMSRGTVASKVSRAKERLRKEVRYE